MKRIGDIAPLLFPLSPETLILLLTLSAPRLLLLACSHHQAKIAASSPLKLTLSPFICHSTLQFTHNPAKYSHRLSGPSFGLLDRCKEFLPFCRSRLSKCMDEESVSSDARNFESIFRRGASAYPQPKFGSFTGGWIHLLCQLSSLPNLLSNMLNSR